MTRSSRKPLSASGFREVISEFDSAKEVVWLNIRQDLSRIMADESRSFEDRLLDILTDVKTASLVASSRSDPELSALDAALPEVVSVLAPARLGRGVTDHRPRLGPGLVGRGWHQPELIGPETYGRWSGPGVLSSIFIPHLAAGAYWVEGYLRFFIEGAEDGFQVRLGDDFISPTMTRQTNGWRFRVRTTIEQAGRCSFSKLEFHCSLTGRPCDMGGEDDRTLGFFLSRIEINRA